MDNRTTSVKEVIDLPFDMNNLFSFSYSFEQIKLAIEFLAK